MGKEPSLYRQGSLGMGIGLDLGRLHMWTVLGSTTDALQGFTVQLYCTACFAQLKLIYSEKVTNFCEIFTIDLSYVVTVKSAVDISQFF